MTEASQTTFSVRLSIDVYRFLLLAYPSTYRQEYGPHMAQVFRDLCLHTYTTTGRVGMLRLWSRTLIDFFSSVIEQHLQKGTFMSKQKFVRLSGFLLILVGLHKILAILPDPRFRYVPSLLFPTLWQYVPLADAFILIGLFVLMFRFFKQSGRSQRYFISLSAAGALINFIVSLIYFLPLLLPIVQKREDYYQPLFESALFPLLFGVGIYAIYAIYIGLIGFAIVSLVQKTKPIAKTLPFFMGAPYLIYSLIPITKFFSRETNILISTAISQIIPGLGWIALGIMLISIPITSAATLNSASLTGATR